MRHILRLLGCLLVCIPLVSGCGGHSAAPTAQPGPPVEPPAQQSQAQMEAAKALQSGAAPASPAPAKK